MVIPWRDTGFGFQFSADGHVHTPGEDPRAEMRVISPGFFASLGVPILSGRDFNERDGKKGSHPVFIFSETLAKRMLPNHDAASPHVFWTGPVPGFAPFRPPPPPAPGLPPPIHAQPIRPPP